MNQCALERLLSWMKERGFVRFVVFRPENFAWLTGGGDNTVVVGEGVAWLEIIEGETVLHTSRIEAARLIEEEVKEISKIKVHPWYALPEPKKTQRLGVRSHTIAAHSFP